MWSPLGAIGLLWSLKLSVICITRKISVVGMVGKVVVIAVILVSRKVAVILGTLKISVILVTRKISVILVTGKISIILWVVVGSERSIFIGKPPTRYLPIVGVSGGKPSPTSPLARWTLVSISLSSLVNIAELAS